MKAMAEGGRKHETKEEQKERGKEDGAEAGSTRLDDGEKGERKEGSEAGRRIGVDPGSMLPAEKACVGCGLTLPVEAFPRLDQRDSASALGLPARLAVPRTNRCTDCYAASRRATAARTPPERLLARHVRGCHERSRRRGCGDREGITAAMLAGAYAAQAGRCGACGVEMEWVPRHRGQGLGNEDRMALGLWERDLGRLVSVDRVDASDPGAPYFDAIALRVNYALLCVRCNGEKSAEDNLGQLRRVNAELHAEVLALRAREETAVSILLARQPGREGAVAVRSESAARSNDRCDGCALLSASLERARTALDSMQRLAASKFVLALPPVPLSWAPPPYPGPRGRAPPAPRRPTGSGGSTEPVPCPDRGRAEKVAFEGAIGLTGPRLGPIPELRLGSGSGTETKSPPSKRRRQRARRAPPRPALTIEVGSPSGSGGPVVRLKQGWR